MAVGACVAGGGAATTIFVACAVNADFCTSRRAGRLLRERLQACACPCVSLVQISKCGPCYLYGGSAAGWVLGVRFGGRLLHKKRNRSVQFLHVNEQTQIYCTSLSGLLTCLDLVRNSAWMDQTQKQLNEFSWIKFSRRMTARGICLSKDIKVVLYHIE